MMLGAIMLCGSAAAAACTPKSADDWTTYQAHVLVRRNDPVSVASAAAMRLSFCAAFGVTPCAPPAAAAQDTDGDSALHIFEDFGVSIPRALVGTVLPWISTYRLGHTRGSVQGADADLDVLFHPLSGCPALDVGRYYLTLGHRFAFNTNAQTCPSHPAGEEDHNATELAVVAAAAAAVAAAAAAAENSSWAFTCSEDTHEQCVGPFAAHTTCQSPLHAVGFHAHLYFVNNDPASLVAKAAFMTALSTRFGLNVSAVLADNTGHEQNHNSTGWLGGPGATSTAPPASNVFPQGGSGSSFATGTFSLYVYHADFADVVSWMLQHRNADHLLGVPGGRDLAFLLHPCQGCNFADHALFSMHGGWQWPGNRFGLASEGGYGGAGCPALDEQCASFGPAGAAAQVPSCSAAGSWEEYTIALQRPAGDDAAAAGSAATRAALSAALGAHLSAWVDAPCAFGDGASPFLAAASTARLGAAGLPAALEALGGAAAGTDAVLVPSGGCPYHDATRRSLYWGQRWVFNDAALVAGNPAHLTAADAAWRTTTKVTRSATATAAAAAAAAAAATAPYAWLLQVLNAPNNDWANAAKAKFMADFAAATGAGACNASSAAPADGAWPLLEPRHDALCTLGIDAHPFTKRGAVPSVSVGTIYIPSDKVGTAVPWAMEHKSADASGYELDLLLVPLHGEESRLGDYTLSAARAGHAWPLNRYPLTTAGGSDDDLTDDDELLQ
jgi:aromatic ring-cleaving dioxygenase